MPATKEFNCLDVNQQLAEQIQNVPSEAIPSSFVPIIRTIQEFENQLKPEQEIAMKLGSFGHSITLFIEQIICIGDSIMVFNGNSPSGEHATLMQNVSQLSFVLAAIPKSPMADTARRIIYPISI